MVPPLDAKHRLTPERVQAIDFGDVKQALAAQEVSGKDALI